MRVSNQTQNMVAVKLEGAEISVKNQGGIKRFSVTFCEILFERSRRLMSRVINLAKKGNMIVREGSGPEVYETIPVFSMGLTLCLSFAFGLYLQFNCAHSSTLERHRSHVKGSSMVCCPRLGFAVKKKGYHGRRRSTTWRFDWKVDCCSSRCSGCWVRDLLGGPQISQQLNIQINMSSNPPVKKESEVDMLRRKLNDIDISVKQEGIRGIIDHMTAGKDVAMLFMDVLKNMETPSIQLKKLIYLYVMSYAKAHPDLAILGVNTFRKDAMDKNNPFLRGLAVRTMGCIRIKQITGYLCDPLKKAMRDEDPYVRKTGALCVPKLYQINPSQIQEEGFLNLLLNLLNDGNASVVSNAIASLSICSELKGEPLLRLTDTLVQKMLTAMNDCNQWGAVYILDTLSGYIPKNPSEAESIMERVSSRLSHTNSAVALSSIRLILKYMDYLSNAEAIRSYNHKISPPLITMISRENEISYLVLKTINLVLQKRPLLLPKELKIFFVNYHDPLYLKLEKLQVLSKIANNENILIILHEIREYLHEVDVEFVRKTVSTMGKCAIKLEKMADKCVQCLAEALKTKIPYVVQEVVIVFRDIFRKYPKTYDGLLGDICANFDNLDDPQAKASIIWIVGEYIDIVGNADDIMSSFIENFKDEPDVVQQQILITCMKLYLHRPEEAQQLLKDLFRYITKECQNPDLRDRGYIYWRLLSTSPQMAKKIVLSERPLISDQSYSLETEFLEKLMQNIGTLSSVYCKRPEDFVKRLKDNANAREVIVQDSDVLLQQKPQEDKHDLIEPEKQVTSFANKEGKLIDNSPLDLLQQSTIQESSASKISPQKPAQNVDLLSLDTQVKPINPQAPQNVESSLISSNIGQNQPTSMGLQPVQSLSSQFSPVIQQPTIFDVFPETKNIVVPFVDVLKDNQSSREGRYIGLSIKGAFQREGDLVILHLILHNATNVHLQDFAFKMSSNAFKLGYAPMSITDLEIPNGDSREIRLELSPENTYAELQSFPYFIDCALKIFDDIFVFKVPCSLSVAMISNSTINIEDYKRMVSNEQIQKKEQVLMNKLPLEQFLTRMKDNNLVEMMRQDRGQKELVLLGCELIGGIKLISQVIFDKPTNAPTMRLIGPDLTYITYFYHALSMIANV